MGMPNVAVILAGAVAKGAFEAGALEVLGKRKVNIVRIVGASSGALNAAVLAGGVHTGDVPGATAKLVRLWQDDASLKHVFDVNWNDVHHLRGVSDQKKVLRLLEANVEPAAAGNPVDLRVIAAPLGGTRSAIGTAPATTYERVFAFDETDFTTREALQRVFMAAAASASFPVAFAPFDPGAGAGPCVDGGIVNNTPIKYAVEGGDVDTVVVVAPTAQVVAPETMADLGGVDLLGHVADMLVNERLYRDLREASEVNDALGNLGRLGLSPEVLDQVKVAIGWAGRKTLDIVAIRPLEPLPGNSFSGFWRAGERKDAIELGRERALEVLGDRWR